MATFPTYAKLLHEGYRVARQPAVLRTEMESGPPKQARVRYRALVVRELKYALATLTDYQNFITWFRTDVAHGADWFDWTDPVDATVKQARLVGGAIEEEVPNKQMDVWVLKFRIETWDS